MACVSQPSRCSQCFPTPLFTPLYIYLAYNIRVDLCIIYLWLYKMLAWNNTNFCLRLSVGQESGYSLGGPFASGYVTNLYYKCWSGLWSHWKAGLWEKLLPHSFHGDSHGPLPQRLLNWGHQFFSDSLPHFLATQASCFQQSLLICSQTIPGSSKSCYED